jgi:hypothetical protein
VGFLQDPANRDVAEALLLANVRGMTEALARQSLDVLLDGESGFFEDVRLDRAGMETVLRLRSNFGQPRRALSDAAKYIDTSYHGGARR